MGWGPTASRGVYRCRVRRRLGLLQCGVEASGAGGFLLAVVKSLFQGHREPLKRVKEGETFKEPIALYQKAF